MSNIDALMRNFPKFMLDPGEPALRLDSRCVERTRGIVEALLSLNKRPASDKFCHRQ